MNLNNQTTVAVCCLVLTLVFTTLPIYAEYVLSAPPRETPEKGAQTYGPIAKKLSVLLGTKVVYESPAGWFDYSRKMRNNKYDIIFDGPHFTAWRVKHLNHIPVVVLPGSIGFYLITHNNNSVASTRDLVGKKICGLLSPNLGTSMVYEFFPNPLLQPVIHEVKGGMMDVYAGFNQGACQAAILRNSTYARLSQQEQSRLKIISKTKPLPNQTITISHRLRTQANRIADFMISKEGAIAAQYLLSRYSNQAQYFEQTQSSNYVGIERLLEGVVWGW